MRKLSKSQLKSIKKQYSQQKNTVSNTNLTVQQKKAIARGKLTREQRKQIKNLNEDKTIKIEWNIKVGDLVYVRTRKKNRDIGLVLRENASGEFNENSLYGKGIIGKARSIGEILVMSNQGFIWVRPSSVEKIS